jgi:hypothetical protein
MRMSMQCLAIALLAAGSPLAGQETARERAQAVLNPEVFQGIEALASEATREGIPEEPLFNKALEGIAKRVPQDRLVPAVTAYATRLRAAHQAFGGTAPAPLLVAGADALQRGVRAETLRGLGESENRSAMAVLVLADLVEAGVPGERALSVLREAMRMRTRQQAVLDIPAQVRRLIREGRSPQEAADQVRRALQRGRGGDALAPVPPGSEPSTRDRRRAAGRGGAGGG